MTFSTPESWQRAGATFSFRGNEVFYRDEGQGEPLVCIHGFPTSSWDWHEVWPELVARHRVVAPDLLGFGFSSKPADAAYTVAGQTDLVCALVRSLNLGPVHLLVHDYGTLVAQEWLDRQRKGAGEVAVRSVVCLNGSVFEDLARPRAIQKLLASPVGGALTGLLSERSVARSLRSVFGPRARPTPELLAAMWGLMSRRDGLRRMPRLLGYLRERREHGGRWADAWVHSGVPTRLISGDSDPVAGAGVIETYPRRVPGGDLIVLPGVGHYAHLEAPRAVLEAFDGLHEKLRASRASLCA